MTHNTLVSLEGWNERIAQLPNPHLLQTSQWAHIKQAYGWQALPLWIQNPTGGNCAALVLQRTVTPLKLRVLYVPRGPLLDWENPALRSAALQALEQLAHRQRAIFIKIDAEVELGRGIPGSADEQPNPTGSQVQAELSHRGWRYSHEQIQFRNSVWVDLDGSDEDRLARMKPKTRYNVRLAQKKGMKIRMGGLDDLPMLYRMYAETSIRDGFVIRPQEYYQKAWGTFIENGMGEALIAEVEGEPVAGLMLFFFGGKAWYLHGMSREAHRDKMPNYLLQFGAMQRAKMHHCATYDLWGAPEVFDPEDSMWGVFRFKEGLGGQIVRTLGAWDFPTQPLLYALYTRLLPRLLDLLRRRGKQKTRQEVAV